MKHPSLIDWLRLIRIPGLGPVGVKRLLHHFGHPEAVVQATRTEFQQVPDIRAPLVEELSTFRTKISPTAARDELDRLKKMDATILTLGDEGYPPLLLEIADPPPVLFCLGEPSHLLQARMIGVVGSRRASQRGLTFTRTLAQDLAASGVTVVSGLALGIDSAAHVGVLDAGGSTVAVTAVGLDVSYPVSNQFLRRKLIENGCLITEVPLGTSPASYRFPMRNRIISGLSHGVVIVEATEKSGALITSRMALEQGREVFSVPGPVEDQRSKGSNRLLKEGACLMESAKDIFLEMNWTAAGPGLSTRRLDRMEGPRSDSMGCLITCLTHGPVQGDDLARRCQLTVASLSSILLQLELAGIVLRQPGNWFTLRKGMDD